MLRTGENRVSSGGRVVAHARMMRLDHSIKQIFVAPGIVLAASIGQIHLAGAIWFRIAIGLLAATLIASSNYVLNELLDAPSDRLHPSKQSRPAASGLVHRGWGYAQWIVLMLAGMALAAQLGFPFALSAAGLWIMGCVYNIPPVRSKDLAYLDVLTESINNPLRFCLGWYSVVSSLLPPTSLLISYWMLGCFFMTLKRFSEYRQIADHERAAGYRRSFAHYSEEALLNSATFYAASSMLFFGAFIMRYRIELILSFPVIAWLMAVYFSLSFRHDSPVQRPELLFREPKLMVPLCICIALMVVLLFVNVPWIAFTFPKSAP
ncbi:MAG TPA: UbiA family prenyltransferase [Terracidiphilus sp.]|nr:UbiA family prenyltransferase [Terracidiphilus sp.]